VQVREKTHGGKNAKQDQERGRGGRSGCCVVSTLSRTNHTFYLWEVKTLISMHDSNNDLIHHEDQMQVRSGALNRCLFPVGNMNKSQVKQIARESGLPHVLQKKESMGICFIGKRDFGPFLKEYISAKYGEVRTLAGQKLGTHDGSFQYTVGQRYHSPGLDRRYYIVDTNVDTNVVTVVNDFYHPALYFDELITLDVNWIIGSPPEKFNTFNPSSPSPSPSSPVFHCQYRTFSQGLLGECTISTRPLSFQPPPLIAPPKSQHFEYIVRFPSPCRAAAKGQTIAFFKGDECLGGGTIARCGPSYQAQQKPVPPKAQLVTPAAVSSPLPSAAQDDFPIFVFKKETLFQKFF